MLIAYFKIYKKSQTKQISPEDQKKLVEESLNVFKDYFKTTGKYRPPNTKLDMEKTFEDFCKNNTVNMRFNQSSIGECICNQNGRDIEFRNGKLVCS